MTKQTSLYALLLLFGVFLGAVSQVLLKRAAMRQYSSPLREYLNCSVLVAYALFFGTTLFSVSAYRVLPLSMGPILESTSYIYVTAFSVVIFHEKLNKKKILALALIIIGIILYSL